MSEFYPKRVIIFLLLYDIYREIKNFLQEKFWYIAVAMEGKEMNKIGSYGIYQNSLYENSVQSAKEKEKTSKAGKSEKNGQVRLSSRAKKLLEELQKRYKNMDFMVADYETEEEAASYLNRGTKEYSVLIDPETLEAMAADADVKEKYIGKLEEATKSLTDMKEQLGEEGNDVTRLGISIDKDGSVSYFAELEKMGEKQRERIEKAREDKKEEKAEWEKKAENKETAAYDKFAQNKKTTVWADSPEELLSKIKNVDWDKVKTQNAVTNGGNLDFKA